MSKALRLATIAGLVTQVVEAVAKPKRLKGRRRRVRGLMYTTKIMPLTATQKRRKRKVARASRARTFNWPHKPN